MIGSGLRCRVRTVGCVRSGLRKRRIVRAERTVNLVGGYVQEAEVISNVVAQARPECPDLLEERECSVDVRADEIVRASDGAVYVTLCGKVHDRGRLRSLKQSADNPPICHIAVYELISQV